MKRLHTSYSNLGSWRTIHNIPSGVVRVLFDQRRGIYTSIVLFILALVAAIWLSGVLGKNPQAANQIALNLSSMTFMVAMGFGVAAMVRVGNQKGLKRFDELRRIAFSIFLLSTILAVIFAILFFIFHQSLPSLYLNYDNPIEALDNLDVASTAATLLLQEFLYEK